ncbi:MAG: DUF4145 domain-containing protein [Eubacterium sp.]|nr:DUF4145 domain-containing protein [Eubacterium sp.]
MSNFEYLNKKEEYSVFSATAIEAENFYTVSPAMCAVWCRKALELSVKWVYFADTAIQKPYKDNLQSLILEPSFRSALDEKTWKKLLPIIDLGNRALHSEKEVSNDDALRSLKCLFDFIQWVDYCYSADYKERYFDLALVPAEHTADKNISMPNLTDITMTTTYSNNDCLVARKLFEEYMRKQRKKESTVNSYCCAINKHVLKREKLNWNTLTYHIDEIVPLYNYDGIYKEIGMIGHNTVISALKMFMTFVHAQ